METLKQTNPLVVSPPTGKLNMAVDPHDRFDEPQACYEGGDWCGVEWNQTKIGMGFLLRVLLFSKKMN